MASKDMKRILEVNTIRNKIKLINKINSYAEKGKKGEGRLGDLVGWVSNSWFWLKS